MANVSGTNGNDWIATGAESDFIVTGDGNDFVDSGAGDDYVDAGSGNDYILTGDGNDVSRGRDGDDVMGGGNGHDNIMGEAGNDALFGDAGNDFVSGGAGNDFVYGGDGNDSLYGDDQGGTISNGPATRGFSYVNNFDGADALMGATQTLFGGAPGVTNVHNSPEFDGDKEFVFVQGFSSAQGGTLAVSPNLSGTERVTSLDMTFVLDMASPSSTDIVDGISINFGNFGSLPANQEYENGVSQGLAIRLDPLANITEIRWNGVVICSGPTHNLETRIEGQMRVTVTQAGVVSVTYAGDAHPYLVATIPSNHWAVADQTGWNFGYAARTGDNAAYIYVDDVNIQASIYGTPVMTATSGSDLIDGGWGDDLIVYGVGHDTVFGGGGNDTIDEGPWQVANSGNNLLYGGAGHDLIFDASGHDTIYGGDGSDSLIGDNAGDDVMFGDRDNDRLHGGQGHDYLDGGQGADLIFGGEGNDRLDGGGNADGESDTIFGDAGDDAIVGGAGGADLLYGGDGRDTLSGGLDVDVLYGDAGDDVLFADQATGGTSVEGADSLFGGDGHDHLVLNANANLRGGLAVGGNGNDFVSGSAQGDTIDGGRDSDTLLGRAGHDSIDGNQGADLIFGGEGNDRLDGGGNADGESDTIFGDAGDDAIVGGAGGADLLYGGDGRDTLSGGLDVDVLYGDAGDDVLFADQATGGTSVEGADSLFGGDGHDHLVLNANANLRGGLAVGGNGNDFVSGTGQADLIYGDAGNDGLYNGAGSDTVYGGAGDDYVADAGGGNATTGADLIYGGDGNDNMRGSQSADTISGDLGEDYLNGGDSGDQLFGGDGNDLIEAGRGDDLAYGGAGNDYIIDAAFGQVDGGLGHDRFFGGDGNDTLIGGVGGDLLESGTGNDSVLGESGDDRIGGEAGDDFIDGGSGNDLLFGDEGNDSINGNQGADLIYGGDGNDTLDGGGFADGEIDSIFGGAGDDSIVGGAGGADLLYGGDGRDTLSGGLDVDVLYGDAGDDVLFADQATGGTSVEGADSLFGGDGNDHLVLNANANLRGGLVDGGNGNDFAFGTGFGDTMRGGAGNDTLDAKAGDNTVFGDDGDDTLLTETGKDSVFGGAGNDAIQTGLGDDVADGGAGNDWFNTDAGDDTIFGGDGDDTTTAANLGNDLMYGGAGRDFLAGGDGNDAVYGDAGNDGLEGNAGNDLLSGGDGDDDVLGGAGDDGLSGDAGNDFVAGGAGNDLLSGGAGDDFASGGDGDDTILTDDGNDSAFGGAGNDAIQTGLGDDVADGGAGNDWFNTDAGDDTIFGGDGDDTTTAANLGNDLMYGGAGRDFLAGGDGNDAVYGDAGNDGLEGNAGNDLLSGGAGDDFASGGAGDEIVVASNAFGTDTAFGGETGETGVGDRIDLTAMTTNTVLTFTGSEAGVITSAGASMDFAEFEMVNLGSGADIVTGDAGNNAANAGAGNDFLNGGAGSDTLDGGSGDDLFVFNFTQNAGATDRYDGGANTDELHISVTAAEWANPVFQSDVAGFLAHIDSGSAADFVFASTGLTVRSIEKFTINIDGVPTDPRDADLTLGNDTLSFTEDGPAVAVNLLANDLVEDRAGSVQILGNSAYGSLSLANTLLTTPQTAILTFTPNANAQTLRAGEVVSEVITYQVTDVDGDVQTASVTLTLTGANDAATIVGLAAGTLIEDGVNSVSGNLTVTDVDNGEAVFQTPANLAGTFGSFAFDAATGAWSYAVGADVQSLAVGQQVQDSLTVISRDGTASQVIQVTITGTNDVPTVVALTAAVAEDAAAVSLNLLAGAADVDNGAVLSVANVSGLVAGVSLSGTTLTVDPTNAAFQSLALGQTQTIVVSYDVLDEQGASVPQSATITITGTNDVPTVAALTAAVTEDAAAVSLNLLAGAADVDNGAVLSVANVSGLVAGVSLSGTTLTVDPTNAAFQSLALGQTQTIVVSYDVLDEQGASVAQTATITITGTNDTPTVAALTAAVAEDASAVSLNLLAGAADVDNGAVLSVANVSGLVAGVSLSGTTLTVDPTNAAFQSLALGQTQTIVVSYDVLDEQGASVPQSATITVTGTNDTPTVAALTAAVAEDASAVSLNLLAGAADVDNGAVLSVANVSGLVAGVSLSGTTLTVDPTNAAFQSLALGQTQTIVVSYDVLDEQGASVPQSATITITGTNDTPTVAALTAAVAEDAAAVSLNLLAGAADVDNGAVLSVANVSGLVAGFSLIGTTLTVDPTNAAFQSLALGQTQTIVVSYDVLDEQGASVPQSATITVTGTNDTPTVAALTAAVAEDASAVSLNLLAGAQDVDNGAVLSVANVSGLVAGVSLSGTTLTVDPTNAAFQSLALGQTQTIVVSYDVLDEQGASVAQTATITVTGTNDTPTVVALTAAVAEDASAVSLNLLAGAADVDTGAVLSVANVSGLVAGVSLIGTTLTVDPTNAAFQSLALGQTQTIVVSYDVLDEQGASVAQTATITVTGTNDTPTVVALTAAVAEDASAVSLNLLAGAADVDNGAVLSVANVSGLVAGVSLTGTTLTVDPTNAAFQSLALGQTQTIVVSYDVLDEQGASVPQSATITITGTNDVPTVAALTAAVTEDASAVSLNLLAGAADVDNGAVLSVANVSGLVAGVSLSGTTLTVDPTNAAFQSLALGQTQTIVVSYDVLDEQGASVPQSATITITGTNDVPTVVALTAAVTEDAAAVSLNLLAGAADVDNGAVLSVANVSGLVAGVSLSGTTLTVDPTNAAFQSLALGQTQTIVVSYDVLDEQGASVAQTATITITGTNDTPTVAALTAAVAEDASAVSLNLLAGAQDVDNGAVLSVANVSGLVAGVSLSGTTLTVDPTNAAFQSLALGQTQTIVVSYDVLDEQGASVPQSATITITGTNDVPTVAALTAAVTEDAAAVSLNLLAGAADVDNGAVLSVANVSGLVAGVSLSGTTLSIDPTNAAFQSLALGQTQTIVVSYDVLDDQGASVPQSATITLTGTNDTPTVVGGLTSITTDSSAAYSINLLAGASDVDDGAVLSVTNFSGLIPGLTVVNNSLSVDPSQFKFLADGETQTFTISYDVTDADGASVAQTTSLTVTGANDAPTVVATTVITNEDTGSILVQLDQIADDIDNDDDGTSLTYAITSGPDLGTATLNGTDLTYVGTPEFQSLAQGETREVTIEISATDGNGATAVNTVSLTVQGVNDAPEFAPVLAPFATLDGNDGFVTQPIAGFQDEQVTYEGWFRWDGSANAGAEILFYNGDTSTEGFGVIGTVVNGALDLQVLAGGVAVLPTTASLQADIWYHVALTRDGVFNLYLNGQAVAVDNSGTIPNSPTGNGVFAVGVNQDGAEQFTGDVAEVRVWTFALDQATIDAGQTRAVSGGEAGLAAAWNFAGGTNNIAPDPSFGPNLLVQGDPVFQTGATGGWPSVNPFLRGDVFDLPGDGSDTASDGFSTAFGALEFTDVDINDTHTVDITPNEAGYLGTMSTFILSEPSGPTAGSLSWQFNVDNAALDFLVQGETRVQTYTLSLQDTSGAVVTETITVTIRGTNDAAVAANVAEVVVQDESITGQLTAIDPDAQPGDVLTFFESTFTPGLTINPDGSYSFDASGYGPVAPGESQEVMASFGVIDALGAVSADKTLVITIINQDDLGMRADAFVFNAPADGGQDMGYDLTPIQPQTVDPVNDDVFVWNDTTPLLDLTTGDAIL